MTDDDSFIKNAEPLGDGLVVQLAGEINFNRTPALRNELLALIQKHQPNRLILDMKDVPYMDSSGVATLVEAMQQQRVNKSKLVLCNLQPKVRSIFEIARLDLVFTLVDSREAAADA